MAKKAVVIAERDNVATATIDLPKGTEVSMFAGDKVITVKVAEDIPFGHKLAISDIGCQDEIIKYGETIGKAIRPIPAGCHVHVHNVESRRGRGDKETVGLMYH